GNDGVLYLSHESILKLSPTDFTSRHELKHHQGHLRSLRVRPHGQMDPDRIRPLEGHITIKDPNVSRTASSYRRSMSFDEINAQRWSVRAHAIELKQDLLKGELSEEMIQLKLSELRSRTESYQLVFRIGK